MDAEHGPVEKGARRCVCGARFSSPSKLRKHVAKYERGGEPTAFQAAPIARSPFSGRRRGAYG